MIFDVFVPKIPKYKCDVCNYITDNKKDFNKHNLTRKHLIKVKSSEKNDFFTNVEIIGNEKIPKKSQDHICIYCNKKYITKSGLWRHNKTCVNIQNDIEQTPEQNDDEENKQKNMDILINLFQEQLKENKELKELIIEQQKKIMEISAGTNITNNNNNTTNNNKFNLNIFLNEKCKDAFNITDFINSIDVGFKDFENFGRLGYVGSINNILIRELKGLDVYKRPIHCSDLKREVIHVKYNDTWVKDEDKKHMKRAIKLIEHKNIKLVPKWLEANPKADDITTKKHEEYMKILDNSMGEIKDEDNERNYEKIIKNVAKEIHIDKEK